MATLSLICFGPPRLEQAGEPVPLTRRRVTALLVYLALTGRPHSRDALAALFWPERDSSSARQQLRRELFRLKEATGEELWLIDREQVALRPDAALAVDVIAFRGHLGTVAAHGHAPGRLCHACEAELVKAVALYADDFLAGFTLPDSSSFDEWQFFQGEELRQQLAGALQTLIAWRETQGQADEALPLARRWLALDSLHEEAHRTLMRLYSHAGQHAAALRQYEVCVHLLDEELGVEPEAETTALNEQIRARQLPAPATGTGGAAARDLEQACPPPARLPAQLTALVGRQRELAEIAALLAGEDGPRLLTLLGPGGIGKTRLAVEAARQAAPAFDGAVCYVSLAPLDDPARLAPEIAGALGLDLAAEDLEAHLLAHLRERRLLLVLDNFEHLMGGEPLVAGILQASPDVHVLVTSRERLNLSGELVYALDGLAYPLHPERDSYRATLGYDAMVLLLQRAQLVRPGYEPQGTEELAALARICRLVQGMPLALVLAAGWLELLSPAEVAGEIARNLDFLESDLRDLPPRQRSVRAVFDASWGLLDEPLRQALACLAVFRGPFGLDAAQAVSEASLPALRRLANQSWLQRAGEHYEVHELLRQYAEERLRAEPGRWAGARERHAHYYAAFLQRQFEALNGSAQEQAFAAIGAARDNLFVAWDWWLQEGTYARLVHELLPALFRWQWQEMYTRASQFIAMLHKSLAALPAGTDSGVRIILLAALSAFFRDGAAVRFAIFGNLSPAYDEALREGWRLATEDGQYPAGFWGVVLAAVYGSLVDARQGLARLERLLAEFRAQNRRWEVAFTLQQMVFVILRQQEPGERAAEASTHIDEAYALFQALGDRRESAYSLRLRGHLARIRQDFQRAIDDWQTAHDMLGHMGDPVVSIELDWHLGDVYLQLGRFAEAFDHYRRMREGALATRNRPLASRILGKESMEASRYGQPEHAWQLRREALALSQQSGDLFSEAWSTWEMGELYRLRGERTAAREWFERAHVLFEAFGEEGGPTFYERGLGDLALDAAHYDEARRRFSGSVAQAEQTAHVWSQAYARRGLGLAALGLADEETARCELAQALELARKTGDRGITLAVLAAVARLELVAGGAEQTAALAGYVAHHPVSWRQTKTEAQAILNEAGIAPPQAPDEDIWTIAASLQADLDQAILPSRR